MVSHELLIERDIIEDILRTRLAIIEVPADRPHVDVIAILCGHLLVLDIAHTAIGI